MALLLPIPRIRYQIRMGLPLFRWQILAQVYLAFVSGALQVIGLLPAWLHSEVIQLASLPLGEWQNLQAVQFAAQLPGILWAGNPVFDLFTGPISFSCPSGSLNLVFLVVQ